MLLIIPVLFLQGNVTVSAVRRGHQLPSLHCQQSPLMKCYKSWCENPWGAVAARWGVYIGLLFLKKKSHSGGTWEIILQCPRSLLGLSPWWERAMRFEHSVSHVSIRGRSMVKVAVEHLQQGGVPMHAQNYKKRNIVCYSVTTVIYSSLIIPFYSQIQEPPTRPSKISCPIN